jgi:hypothetical protein
MRLVCFFETGDKRYQWLNESVVIASSARCGDQGELAIYLVLQSSLLLVVYDAYIVN